MKNPKYISMQIVSVLMSAALLAACENTAVPEAASVNAEVKTSSAAAAPANTAAADGSQKTAAAVNTAVTYDKDDEYTDWQSENPNYIELKDTTAALKGSGATVDNNKVTIMLPGVYVLSGKLSDGQIVVDLQDKGTVKLVLNGVDITSRNNAPIYVKQAEKAIISLPDGTQNTVTDGQTYASSGTEDEPNAAIYSKGDLTINGAGALTVQANYKDGITGRDDLKMTGGKIKIQAADDGLLGRDMAAVKAGTLTIVSGGDGIKSTNDTDAGKGFVTLEGGTFDITAGADGIQAATNVRITEGKYTLTTGGGSAKAAPKAADNRMQGGRNPAPAATAAADDSTSAKAVKAVADVTITGGTFTIDSADDALHSNNSLTVAGGNLTITSGDDGIHADASVTIQGGVTNIKKSYEGVESALITIAGGETHVTASDDGLNVSAGDTGGEAKLEIKGGYVSVDSAGDGLDANGSITMTDGTVVVSGPTANMNGAIDYDGQFQMTGGFLVAAGSSGMSQAPSDSSTQYSILMTFPQVQQAGTLVTLKDSKDNIVASYTPNKPFQTLVIASPNLKKDGSYTLYTGGTPSGQAKDGLYTGGSVKDAAQLVTFTVTNSVTWLNESGVTAARSGQMGPGGGGGMRGGNMAPGGGGQMPQGGQGGTRPQRGM